MLMTASDQFSNLAALIAIDADVAARHLVPPPDLRPSEWSERHVQIALGNAVPGPIRFANAPYQRGMIDAATEPGCKRVSLMLGAQTGKTTVLQCLIGYFIAHEPRSQILLQPSQGDMQTFLETKLRPMIDGNPILANTVAKPRGREGVNNGRTISYPGGWLMMSWAGSPKTLRGRSAPVVVTDEIDGMEATSEGDPVQLIHQRSATFGDQALLLESSTPTRKGASRIETAFDDGDRRRFYVPCPHCGHRQVLKWAQVTWSKDAEGQHLPETAGYMCEGDDCGTVWNDGERVAAIRQGEWVAERPFRGHASFHLNEMYSCFRRLRDIVQSFLDKKSVGDLQSFVNVSLAETWEEKGEQIDPASLMARAETYPAPVPAGAVYLTAGIDMQDDRLEVEVVGWGLGEESWNVDFRVLWGDPLQGDVWDDLDALLGETFLHQSGAQLPISAACLDTGGREGRTQAAYEYARGKTGRRLFAIKGVPGWGKPIVTSPMRKGSGKRARKVDLFAVGVDEAKVVVARRLTIPSPGPGYCHFPKDRDPEFYAQLTAEKLMTKQIRGFSIREWHQTRPRNEAFDCRVYATAALKIMNPNLMRLTKHLHVEDDDDEAPPPPKPRRDSLQPALPKPKPAAPKGKPPEEAKAPDRQPAAKPARRPPRRRPGVGWVNRW